MASHKHRSAFLVALSEKEVPIETTPQEVLSLMGEIRPYLILPSLFLMKNFHHKGPLTLDLCKSPSSA